MNRCEFCKDDCEGRVHRRIDGKPWCSRKCLIQAGKWPIPARKYLIPENPKPRIKGSAKVYKADRKEGLYGAI